MTHFFPLALEKLEALLEERDVIAADHAHQGIPQEEQGSQVTAPALHGALQLLRAHDMVTTRKSPLFAFAANVGPDISNQFEALHGTGMITEAPSLCIPSAACVTVTHKYFPSFALCTSHNRPRTACA